MDPVLRVINYLFQKHNISNDDMTVQSFFHNFGFPRLINIAFNINKFIIPQNQKGENKFRYNYLNTEALKYLFMNNQDIKEAYEIKDIKTVNINFFLERFKTDEEKTNLLALVLTKLFFKIDKDSILKKCNIIVSKIKINFDNESDLVCEKCILALLSVLTDGKVSINPETSDFNTNMKNSFQKAEIPLVIDESSLEKHNTFIFFIQILIIFESKSDKVNDLREKYKKIMNEEEERQRSLLIQKIEEEKKDAEKEIWKKEEEERQRKLEIQKEEEEREKELEILLAKTLTSSRNQSYSIEFSDDSGEINKVEDDEFEIDDLDDDDESNITVERQDEAALLKALNALGNNKLNFRSLHQTIERNNLLRFVILILDRNHDKQCIKKIKNGNKTSVEKINDTIKYLGQNEPLFNVLQFNFKEKRFALSSAYLFYTNLLNIYFLKKTKEELFERLSTIIFSQIDPEDTFYAKYNENIVNGNDPYKDRSILLQWNTYLALVNFVINRTTHYMYDPIKNDDDYFKKYGIPQIIDKKYLQNYEDKVPIAVYYQLQFIFNKLDKKDFIYQFHENLLKAERNIKKIKVPPYDKLATSIAAKNYALKIQKKKYNEFLTRRLINADDTLDLTFEKDKEPAKHTTFIERHIQDTVQLVQTFMLKSRLHKSSPFIQPRYYWNSLSINEIEYDIDSFVHNGVVFKEDNDKYSLQKWDKTIKMFNDRPHPNITVQPSNTNQSGLLPTKEIKMNLYKFFYYNVDTHQWEIDDDSINKFRNELVTKGCNPNAQLIFFSNSYEDELNTILSNQSEFSLPELDNDGIYVYALSNKMLSLLQYKITLPVGFISFKPIFLLIHIPEDCKNLIKNDDIRSIIFRINLFLSIICDIEIVVLNKEHYLEQIKLLKSINSIKRSITTAAEKNRPDLFSSLRSTHKKYDDDCVDDSISSDGDSGDEDDVETEIEFDSYKNDLSSISDIIKDMDIKYLDDNSKYIILLNDKSIKNGSIETNENDFSNFIKKEIESQFVKICYINSDLQNTYEGFFQSLSDLLSEVYTKFNDILNKFNYYPMTDICNIYIYLKEQENWKQLLGSFIYARYKRLKNIDPTESSGFTILSLLDKEIIKVFPSFDLEFSNVISEILNEISKNITKDNKRIEIELEKSSEDKIKCLKEIIESKSFLFDDVNDIICSHKKFLRTEYFNIIHELYTKNDQLQIFIDNQNILDELIDKDTNKIRKIIDDFNEKLKSSCGSHVKIPDNISDGTNYTIRETEQIKETEVLVPAGHLKDVIKQDF